MSLVVPFDEIFAAPTGVLGIHDSWDRVELGDVCEIVNGFPFRSQLFGSAGFPIVRIRNLVQGATDTYFAGDIPREALVHDGDLLIGMDGIFRCVEWNGGTAGLNQRVCRIIPDERFLDRRFLLRGLNGYLSAIQEATSSVTVKHLSSKDVLRIPFPLPPMVEQRRIVAKLEELLGKVETCQKRLANVPVILKRFRQSVLAAACSGRLTEDWREQTGGPAWATVLLTDACESITDGDHQPPPQVGSGIPFVTIAAINNGRLQVAKAKRFVPAAYYDSLAATRRPQRGDVLFSVTGSIAIPALVDTDQRFVIQRHVALVRPSRQRLNSEFLACVLATKRTQEWASSVATGTAQLTIPLSKLRVLALDVPSIAEQEEIVRRVGTLLSRLDSLEVRVVSAHACTDGIISSLLAAAFRGDLVPTEAELARREGRSYETAGELLKRVAVNREGTGAKASKDAAR